MNDAGKIITIAIMAIGKLLITGICLAIGFRIGGLLAQAAEKKISGLLVKKPVVA